MGKEQFDTISPDEEPKTPAQPIDDDSMDVSGALAGLLDAVVPSANAEDIPTGAMTVSQFRETYDWSEFEFLPQNVSFGDYIFANAFTAWNEVNAELDEDDTIVPLELLLAIIKRESAQSVTVNSALDVDTDRRTIGFYARGDKFSLAAGASQMIPSTARSYGLRVMYTRDEVFITGNRPEPKDGYGKYSRSSREMTLVGKGWKEKDYLYPIVDQRTSVYHQMRATVRLLSSSYKKALRTYDAFDAMLEVASRYNSGRSKDNIPRTPTGRQQGDYIDAIETYLRQVTPDIAIGPGLLPTQVTVNYEDAKVKPLSISDIVTNEDLKLSLFQFLDENGDIRLDIPLKDIGGESLKIPSGLIGKARRRFERVGADGGKVWDVCSVTENELTVKAVENSNGTLDKRKSEEFTTSSEDEIDMWERPDMWELTLQDVIDLGVRPSELLRLNPQLNLAPILEYRIPDGFEAVIPKRGKEAFEKLIAMANDGLGEASVALSERAQVVEDAKNFLTEFVSSHIIKTGEELKNPFEDLNKRLVQVGMAHSNIGELYEKLADVNPGSKRWVDKIKDNKDLTAIFLEEGFRYISERSNDFSQVSFNDYVCSLAVLELSRSQHASSDILTRHAEEFLIATSLTASAAEVRSGIDEKRETAMKDWDGNEVAGAFGLSQISGPAVAAIEGLKEGELSDVANYAKDKRAELLAGEGFVSAREKVKAYLSTWPKWDDFEFDFDKATFGYEETRELAGVKIPLYKSTLLMIPFQYKPKDATAGETVAYVVFDMAEWKTAEDTWSAGIGEAAGSEETPVQPEISVETPEKVTGGSGEFRVIGLDGTIGEPAELVMDGGEDMDTAGIMISDLVWRFYLTELLGTASGRVIRKTKTMTNGWKLEYIEDANEISVQDNEGYYVGTLGFDSTRMKIYYVTIDPYSETENFEFFNLNDCKRKFG